MRLLESLYARVQRHPFGWLTLALILVIPIAQWGPYATISQQYGELYLFDMHPTFDTNVIAGRLEVLGGAGRQLYQHGLVLDVLFALGNGLLFLVLLRPLANVSPRWRSLALVSVLLAVACDLVENALIAAGLALQSAPGLIAVAAGFTYVKLLAFGLVFAVVILSWIGVGLATVRGQATEAL